MEGQEIREYVLDNASKSWKKRISEGYTPLEARIDTFSRYELTELEKTELFEYFCYEMETILN